uniref:Chemokine receptor-like protein n=1 Tax=Simian cytomegalovirus TaxID=10364 RepID=Q6VFU6_SCMVC|nr:chemokine receptor-like protein [Simian cytomegalovirus]
MTNETCHVNDTLSAYGITPSMIISFYSLTGIIGFTANMVIMYVMYLSRLKRSARDMYFIYMILTDLAMVSIIPLWVHYLLNQAEIYHLECILMSFAFYVPLFLHSNLIVAIAVERYQALVIKNRVTSNTANISVVIICILIILISLPYCIFRETTGFQSCMFGNDTWHVSAPARAVMGITINAWTYVLPAFAMLFFSLRIYSTRRRKRYRRASVYIDILTVTMLCFHGLFNLNIFKNMVVGYWQNKPDCDYIKREHLFSIMGVALVLLRPVISPIICMYVNRKMFKTLCAR